MNNASLRRIFSLLLAVMMVCALLPTVAFAEDIAEPQDGNGGVAAYANSSVLLTLNISSYSAPFYNPTKGTHDVNSFKFSKYINRSDVGSDNPKDCSATAHFVGSNETGWQLYVKLKIDNYEADLPQNAWIYNKDMSAATGTVTFGLSFNTAGGTSTYVHISGGKDLPTPPQPDKPTKPTAEDVKALLGNEVVKIFCGTATPAFNGTPTRTGYVFGGWNPAVAATVTGNATYTAVWEEDANGNGTPDKEEEKYTVSYTDGVENEEIFADQVYGNLLSGTATPAFNGTPTRAGYKFLGWEPTVAETVTESATYVAQWEKLYTVTYTDGVGGKAFKDDVHSDLEKDTKTPAYKDGIPTRKGFKFLGWEPEVAETVTENVTYTAKWGELYTVTYTDGAKGKAFEDQVYENVLSGTKTPNFDGTPTRKGYKFVGWEPEVAETVTENVTYTAKWEELYTVTYTDGVKGKAFEDQVYSDLEAGTDTPKFDGKPTRKGYTFTGWSPKVTDTVTKDVTYVAQWKSVKNGKDNIPKTGDSEIVMVLGSVLLFSFCGAAAVSVYDRKRKHF